MNNAGVFFSRKFRQSLAAAEFEKIVVQEFHRLLDIFFIDNETDVDFRCAL